MAERDNTGADTAERHEVVVNDEGQYSIWWVGRERPAGWHFADFEGTEQECLDHIDQVWTDMRPISVR
ncbi:MbtH family NRPS accessory protein [Streptomyces sioyaensis]|uniref:MbtH family protein n=1 Tax=Streptomyces sioyaensis TaxID=67364 RepID=UPI0033D539CC